jgi:nitrile hydratase beta subunit
MNGVHDMGGMHGFGPIEVEPGEPVFHAVWEGRVLAMSRAMAYTRAFNIDMARYSREALPAATYLGSSYYRRWQLAMERLFQQLDLLGLDELTAGRALRPGRQLSRKLRPDDVERSVSHGEYARPATASPLFAIGDTIRTRNINPPSHTRLPRYARGRAGVIESIRGCHVFPDSTVVGRGEDPHWLYTVVFEARELWGDGADATVKVSIEAWEPYLEAL